MKLFSSLMLGAALSLSFAAAPAMAGPDKTMTDKATDMAKDHMVKKAKKDMKEKAKDMIMDEGADMMKARKMNKADAMMDKGDAGMAMKDTHMKTSDDNMKNMMGHGKDGKMMDTKMSPPAMAPVACPSGTTAQPNGTCMITGDFKF